MEKILVNNIKSEFHDKSCVQTVFIESESVVNIETSFYSEHVCIVNKPLYWCYHNIANVCVCQQFAWTTYHEGKLQWNVFTQIFFFLREPYYYYVLMTYLYKTPAFPEIRSKTNRQHEHKHWDNPPVLYEAKSGQRPSEQDVTMHVRGTGRSKQLLKTLTQDDEGRWNAGASSLGERCAPLPHGGSSKEMP